jgi:hypothetical protein
MDTKAELWKILEKYDYLNEYIDFCDSLSNFIQNRESNEDILTIYKNLYKIDRKDKLKIDNVIGSQIDSFLFSI